VKHSRTQSKPGGKNEASPSKRAMSTKVESTGLAGSSKLLQRVLRLYGGIEQRLNPDIPTGWALLSLFFIAFGLRLKYINLGFFHHDSILLVDAVEKSVNSTCIVPLLDGRYAYVAFHIPFYLLFRSLDLPIDLWFNLLTALIGSLSVLLLYLLTQEITENTFCAVTAASLFAVVPVYLSITTHTMVHAFSVCLGLLSFTLLIKGSRRDSALFCCAASFVLLFAISARFPNILLTLPFVIVYFQPRFEGIKLVIDSDKFSWKLAWVTLPLIIGLVMMLVFQWEALQAKAGYDQFLGPFSPLTQLGISDMTRNIGVPGWILLAGGVVSIAFRPQKPMLVACLIWLLLMFTFYGNVTTYDVRFYTILFPMVSLFISLGLELIHRRSRILGSIVAVYVLFSFFLTIQPIIAERHAFSGEKAYALWVREMTEPNALVITMDDGVFIRYYAGRQVKDHPQGSETLAEAWAAEIKTHLEKGVPVYMMESGFSYDPEKIIMKTVTLHFDLKQVGAHRTEDYHRASIERKVYVQRLFQLSMKNP
jgi:hypothetical protein